MTLAEFGAGPPGSADLAKGTTMAGDDVGSLLGGLLGSGNGSSGSNILGALLSALGKQGGHGSNPLGGLLDTLARSGLAEQKDSWAGTGQVSQRAGGAHRPDAG